ncbi:MAG: 3-oxoacyl-[acyl-carrier-protein] synthase III C-terminal domain-containing protein [Chloroflexota bacterium]|nr:3-oxoacyl-[acyl-carrier-protein] synthase III C-terminal domain-containing protein [Chloroflexota bacterium]
MAVGIISYGAYIPLHRMSREVFYNAWGGAKMGGERSVCNFDEDSVTMAMESAVDCLGGIDRNKIDGLFFATTTQPYLEKLTASLLATAIDLREDIRTLDITDTLRAGTSAVATAADIVKAGSAKSILVAAGEHRMAAPAGDFEMAMGDGGVSLLIGDENVIATIEGSYHISDEFAGVWRAEGEEFIRTWEDRMVLDKGYSEVLLKAIKGCLQKYNLQAGDFAKFVYDSPLESRRHPQMAKSLKLTEEQVQNPLFSTMGNCGSAHAMMMLADALEEAKPGDKILWASYGNGADVFILQVTPEIEKLGPRRGVKKHLESKRMLENYDRYLRWRKLVPLERARRGEQSPVSISTQHRDIKISLALYGVKCKACGAPQFSQGGSYGYFTPLRVCVDCQTYDQMEPYRFSDKSGKLTTYTEDRLADSNDPPTTVTVIDWEDGGRGIFDMTDRGGVELSVGMELEMTFRKLFTDRGVHNYFWKTRPVRC